MLWWQSSYWSSQTNYIQSNHRFKSFKLNEWNWKVVRLKFKTKKRWVVNLRVNPFLSRGRVFNTSVKVHRNGELGTILLPGITETEPIVRFFNLMSPTRTNSNPSPLVAFTILRHHLLFNYTIQISPGSQQPNLAVSPCYNANAAEAGY